ncbi:MAG: hypothetical protein V1821_03885 [bacterium]
MKTLVTHLLPHLDDICGLWLVKRYLPGWSQARTVFLTRQSSQMATYKKQPVDSDPQIIHVGVGRGRFDEHKGDVGKSASLLVFEYLLKINKIPAADRAPLQNLVEAIRQEDTGELKTLPHRNLFLGSLLSAIESSKERTRIGLTLLDAALEKYRGEIKLLQDFKKARSFQTPWGKGVALKTAEGGADALAYQRGFVIALILNPVGGWRMFRSRPDSKVNLTKIYQAVKGKEPQADWFLHHSGKLLLCGSSTAAKVRMSKLSLQEMIELIKK